MTKRSQTRQANCPSRHESCPLAGDRSRSHDSQCMGSRCRACRDRSQSGRPHSKPIDLAADRGFVQSGFNDVPYLATRKSVTAWDLVEPSSIPVMMIASGVGGILVGR
jgi:hypothetical protein